MMQDFLVAWMNWYYGKDVPYPGEFQDQMTYDEKLEAIRKTEQIKLIVGSGPGMFIDDDEWEKEMGR